MPRRNENADYHRPGHQFRGRIYPIFLSNSESPVDKAGGRRQKAAAIKTTGESIVREHRNSIADLIQTPSLERVYKAPWYKAINLDTAFNWVCWAAVIGCLIYLGIFVFAPFTVKLLR